MLVVFFFKQKTAYEIGVRLVGSEMCIRDRSSSVVAEGAGSSTDFAGEGEGIEERLSMKPPF